MKYELGKKWSEDRNIGHFEKYEKTEQYERYDKINSTIPLKPVPTPCLLFIR